MRQDRKLWPETADLEGVTTRWPLRIQPFPLTVQFFNRKKQENKNKNTKQQQKLLHEWEAATGKDTAPKAGDHT